MAFRAQEAALAAFSEMESYFLGPALDLDAKQRAAGKDALLDIVDECGPVVSAYPSWHPLVCNHNDRYPSTTPGQDCGYEGLDHTRYFAHGFITCPYDGGKLVFESVAKLPPHPIASITARKLDLPMYHPKATPILVTCEWHRPLAANHMIPRPLAVAMMLSKELPCWQWASRAETWETMRPYFLGRPHGGRSSLFIDQETAQAMKKLWNALIDTGVFGPIKD